MSSKGQKRASTNPAGSSQGSKSSRSETPTNISHATTSSVQSPTLPTSLSRIQEKKPLASFFANMDKNQGLENKNASMTRKIEDTTNCQMSRVTQEYEKVLKDTCRVVDEISKDKAMLQFEFIQIWTNFLDLKSKVDKKTKIEDTMRRLLTELKAHLDATQLEFARMNSHNETLTSTVNKLESERNSLLDRNKILEMKIDNEQKKLAKLFLECDDDIERLVGELNNLMNLEGRRTPLRSELKRKRGGLHEEYYVEDSSSSYESQVSQAESSGDVEILEDDPKGKFVKLHNKSDKEMTLFGWQLVRRAGEDETIHKFHRSDKIDKDGILSIYSSDVQGVTTDHSTIIMKGQKWFTGKNICTILLNSDGEVITKRETKHVQTSHQ